MDEKANPSLAYRISVETAAARCLLRAASRRWNRAFPDAASRLAPDKVATALDEFRMHPEVRRLSRAARNNLISGVRKLARLYEEALDLPPLTGRAHCNLLFDLSIPERDRWGIHNR
jgi:hypothetical protein